MRGKNYDHARILELYHHQGWSAPDVAKEIGCSAKLVYYVFSKSCTPEERATREALSIQCRHKNLGKYSEKRN